MTAKPERLEFRHAVEKRKAARAAVREHGSIRRAAAALGVGKSTLHDWLQADGAAPSEEGETGNLTPAVDTELSEEEAAEDDEENRLAQAPVEADGPPPSVLQHLTDPLYLRAFRRYVSALANGVHPMQAVETAQAVHPDFDVTEDDNARVTEAVQRILLSEGGIEALLLFADPPGYVKRIYADFAMDDSEVTQLGDMLTDLRTRAYLAGVNAQLSALGRLPVQSVTDPGVLDTIAADAHAAAQQIAETWNRDAASAVGARWFEVAPGTRLRGEAVLTPAERKAAVRSAMEEWLAGRKEWKASLWAADQAGRAYNRATSDFVARNRSAALSAHVEPPGAECLGCVELIQLGEMSEEVAATIDLPLHVGCEHYLSWSWSAWDDGSGQLWAAQADEAVAA